ncbi:hypothetical protein [Halodesulfovibrio spirochaetisodalis]|uniref:hypothetical protein n=1 Tax=Halodesulfovibrio spirochaetisodalis TaxID=1560234 RepID=UPI000A6CDF57|nr:hypothetical protein [Halodesulfovibrio spirochaetisodalis]
MKRLLLCTTYTLLFIMSAVYTAFAGQRVIESSEELLPEWNLSAQYSTASDADVDNSSASYSLNRFQFDASYLDAAFTYRKDWYSWDNTHDITFGNSRSKTPWDSLEHLAAGLTTDVKLGKRGVFQYGWELASNYEKEMDWGSLSGTGSLAYGYFFEENFLVMVGVQGTINYANTTVLPIVGISYLEGPWDVFVGFPKTSVTYSVNENLSFSALAKYDYQTYSLSDSNSVYEDGYVEIREATASLLANWRPLENFQLSLGPELYFARSMRFYDDDGDRKGSSLDSDVAYGLKAGITLEF